MLESDSSYHSTVTIHGLFTFTFIVESTSLHYLSLAFCTTAAEKCRCGILNVQVYLLYLLPGWKVELDVLKGVDAIAQAIGSNVDAIINAAGWVPEGCDCSLSYKVGLASRMQAVAIGISQVCIHVCIYVSDVQVQYVVKYSLLDAFESSISKSPFHTALLPGRQCG